MPESSILIPDPKFDDRLRRLGDELYKQYQTEYNLQHPAPRILNTIFFHDPLWRHNFWSIQNIRDSRTEITSISHLFWMCVGWSFYIAQFGWVLTFLAQYLSR